MESRLSDAEYLAGEYSIADIACYPWISRHEWHQVRLEDFPAVKRWFESVGSRTAVKRGMSIPPTP
jgi:GST-like protein